MEPKDLCENFIAADKIINGEYYDTMTIENKTKYPNYNKHCIMSKCETDMKLDSLSEDLFDQLGTQIEDEYYEYFTMWLSDKLFKIVKEDDITLNEAYEKYLNKNIENWKYWSLLDIKQGLKEVNLMHMKQFYKLLNDICKAIVYYKLNEDDIKKFISNSTECYNQYSSLYDSVPKCNSYHHLLDNLKKTYEDFKNSVHDKIKNEYPYLAKDLQTLTIKNTNPYFVGKIKAFEFNSSECKPQKANEPGPSKKMKQPSGPQSASQKSGASPQSETKHSDKGKGGSKSEKTDSGTQKGNSDSEGGGKGGTKGESGSTGGGSDSQGGSSNQGGSVGGSKASGDQVPTHPLGAYNGYLPSNWGMSFNLMGYMPSVSGIYQSSKNILTSATNQVSDTYTNTVDIVKGAYDSTVNNIKGAYDSTVNNIKDAYDRTMTSITGAYNNAMTSITNAYDRTTNYIGNAVNSVTSQFNPFSTPQSDDNQPGSNSSGGRTDTSNHSQQNPPPPTPPSPSLPSSVTPPDPQKPSLSQPQDPPQTPSLSQPQDPQQIPSPSQPHSNQTQDKLQITVQNDASNTLKQPDPKTGTGGVQTMTITNDTLPSSSTDPSITGSGITTGIVVKMIEKPSIWCIAQNKKYNILSIGIISISIFAFLAIMYKYLSLGCTSKSKRKKNMKKVINSIGGKKPVQIIIKSYDRSKDLKPIINSVGRKKDPLLNIYKLMQADPIPFINLFFLLIFFVYKRKYDFLEL
ncbi:CIR protein PIR protein [Plasmodium vinckei brucechwatti]|uniref:CIR protein PIR protein n=1 Tax=Plasmodium vinckei brucechwatti TaxID=119398 RepID=A0A6V7SDS0_PLAVN|nr:CIR protein PIR protein [Plasmodium vinckei brucechwatti]